MKNYSSMLLTPLLFLPFVSAETDLSALPENEPWLSPSLQIRGRYERASLDAPGIDSADAFTVRERVGVMAKSNFGLSAFFEGEFTQALIHNFDAATGSETSPEDPTLTQINDPENVEVNQAWLLYSFMQTDVKVGRQRMILDNAALVGNSGWRQNEQTYDAVNVQNTSVEDLTLFYSYVNRVNRIFGADAAAVQNHFSGDVHLLNARYSGFTDLVVTGYLYLMDFGDGAQAFSNDTVGLSLKKTFSPLGEWKTGIYGEIAWQTDGGNGPMDYQAWYGHLIASAERGPHNVSLGYERLGAADGTSFKTPLATAHAFNGFSDTLVGARIGGTPGGIDDLYVSYDVKLPWKLNAQAAYHWLAGDDLSSDYGQEMDLVVSRKFSVELQTILKLAFYDSTGPFSSAVANPAPFDASRLSVELNYSF